MATAKEWGGRRPAAGTRAALLLEKTSYQTEADEKTLNLLRTQFDKRCVSSLPRLLDTALDLATGIFVEEEVEGRDGGSTQRVYRKLPDRAMLSFLMEHGIGKAAAKSPSVPDHTIQLVMRHPRPGKKGQAVEEAEEEAEEVTPSEEEEEGTGE